MRRVTTISSKGNIVSYYKFDELSGSLIDYVGANNSYFNLATQGALGKINNSYSYDGVGDYTKVYNIYDFIQNTMVFTIRFWFKTDDINNVCSLFENEITSAGKGFFILYEHGRGVGNRCMRMAILRGVSGSSTIDFRSPHDTFLDNDWHHVVITSDVSQNVNIYVDGVSQTVIITSPFTALSSGVGSQVDATIGAARNNNFFFDGNLDELMVRNDTWTQQDVTYDYDNGNGRTI